MGPQYDSAALKGQPGDTNSVTTPQLSWSSLGLDQGRESNPTADRRASRHWSGFVRWCAMGATHSHTTHSWLTGPQHLNLPINRRCWGHPTVGPPHVWRSLKIRRHRPSGRRHRVLLHAMCRQLSLPHGLALPPRSSRDQLDRVRGAQMTMAALAARLAELAALAAH